ncbi:MAG TPA: hypothetical protein VK826_19135 [Bacteroidia bacterium]|nr:hypothetical protein [Bacteroidia bacterium]
MRTLIFLSLVASLCSCADDAPVHQPSSDSVDIVLELPEIESGMPVDTTLPEIRIAVKIDARGNHPYVEQKRWPKPDSCGDTVNIYAHYDVPCGFVEHIIDSLCAGKDLRIVGVSSGLELGIPFHALHRFPVRKDSIGLHAPSFIPLRIGEAGLFFVDTVWHDGKEVMKFFELFYGNVFTPEDSPAFPERKPQVQSISVLEHEAMAWDEREKNTGPDSAVFLASYNEFVNKLEVYQKAGVFYTLPPALMDLQTDSMITWKSFVEVLSVHRKVQEKLRAEAKTYLAGKLANDGNTDTRYEFTEEDLLLLYPDRLRWNGRMSGPTEHRLDPFHLRVFKIEKPVPVVKGPPEDMERLD